MDGSMPAGWWEGGSHQIECSSDIVHVLLQSARGLCQHIDGLLEKFEGGGGCKDGK